MLVELLKFLLRVFVKVGQLLRDFFEKLEQLFAGQKEPKVKSEFVFLFFVRIVSQEGQFVVDVRVVFFEFVPVIVFSLIIVTVLPFHAFFEYFDKSVQNNHELFGFRLR